MNDATAAAPPDLAGLVAAGIAPARIDLDADDLTAGVLPGDHPAWQRDMLAVSSRVRALLATIRPVVVQVLTFWDHAVRSVGLGNGRALEVDPGGCYRLR